MKIKLKIQTGFTLVEMIIYMAILSIFLIVLTEMFVSILDVKTESEANSSVEQDGRFILARLSYDISRANSISTPDNLGDTASNLQLTIGADTYIYSLVSNNLQISVNGALNNLNSSETTVSGLSFQKLGNSATSNPKDTIKIQFTATSVAQRTSGREVRTFQTTVGTR